jgi:beta-fructofuranosidase
MRTLPLAVVALSTGEPTADQRAAADWVAGLPRTTVTRATVADVVDGRVDLAGYDVCWWHRDRPLSGASDGDDRAVADAAGPVRTFLEGGGGLLLGLHALSAVVPLGIDPVPPDATGTATAPEPSGHLAKRVHADHPAFESFDDLAIHTRAGGGETPYARYERAIPARGDVLAGGVVGDAPLPARNALVEWRVGDGRVLGVGDALAFADVRDYETGAATERLVVNCLGVLGGPAARRPTFTDRPDDAAGFDRLRRRLADDRDRPAYHLAGPAGWVNDPNGVIQYDGRYHVFYQYNPGGPYHGSIHWGHATSDDLLHWRDEPVALSPDPDGPDRDGCWSGCAVVDDGTPTLLYTGGRDRDQLPCLATTDDPDLRSWTKDPDNPIIPGAPDGVDVLETDDWRAEFRDHCVWRENGAWYQVIGSGVRGAAGTVLLYRGRSLDDWTYVGQLYAGRAGETAPVWECPELLDLGEASLLHVSDDDHVDYVLGEADLSTPSFEVDSRGRLDYGDFYAPQSTRLDDGRVLTWGWLPPARDVRAQWDAGWSGTLSAPRELDCEDGRLVQRPARELADLRARRVHGGPLEVAAGEGVALDATGTALELRATATRDPGAVLEVGLLESPGGAESTTLRWEPDGDVVVDRSESSLDPRTDDGYQRVPFDGDDPDRLALHVLVDGSIVEAFVDGREAVTSRVYPTRPDAEGTSLLARDGAVRFRELDAWELAGTFPAGR